VATEGANHRGWFTATALIASHGWYQTLPWFPVAEEPVIGQLGEDRVAAHVGATDVTVAAGPESARCIRRSASDRKQLDAAD